MQMSGTTLTGFHPTIQSFHRAALTGAAEDLPGLLAPDVAFRPPTYWKEWRGRELVAGLLGHVVAIFENFRYHRMWGGHPDYALEFTAGIGDLDLVGIDLVTLNEDGLIADFTVLMRPIRSVQALREAMNARVMADERLRVLMGAS